MRPTVATLVLSAFLAMAGPVRADDERDVRADDERDVRADDKRDVPDYDNRGDEPTDAGDVLIWVPRIVFSPVYFVSEFVLRRPIGFLVTALERSDVPAVIADIFTWDDGRAGIVPTFLFDFGLEAGAMPSAGIYFFWDELFAPSHDLRFRAAVGGEDWVQLDLTNRVRLGDRDVLTLGLDWRRRKDQVFAGIGPAFEEHAIGRYGIDELAVDLGWSHRIGARGNLDLGVALRHYGFFRGGCCEDPVIQKRVDAGLYPLPDGFTTDHTMLGPRLALALDTRAAREDTGARIELEGVLGADTAGRDASFLRVSGELGGYVDIHARRVVGLRLFASATEPLDEGPIPFIELPTLGGSEPMRAFVDGRLRDRSTLGAILEYRWPIWVFLDGTLFAELGNVFGPAWKGLSADDLRMSFGMGVRPASREDHPFELLFAVGTETFGDGLDISTYRIVFGSTSGF